MNLDLWNKVCETDPQFTKKVDFGLKFTSVDAYHLLKRATEQFGPAGHEWGWVIRDIKYSIQTVTVQTNIWFKDKGEFSSIGSAKLYPYKDKEKEDEEATKKALTNSICKGLSYLGFSADVYEGKFDDDKYVQAMRQKTERASNVELDKMGSPEDMKAEILGDLWNCKSYKATREVWNEHRQKVTAMQKMSPEVYGELVKEFQNYADKFDDNPKTGKAA